MPKTLIISKKNPDEVSISQREVDFVKMLSDGYSRKEISVKYKLSIRTIDAAIDRVKVKTGSKTMAHLVGLFFRNKLIS